MAEKQKPQEDIVKLAGRAMTEPDKLTGSDIKRMAARILDDQKNDPKPNKSKGSLASQVIAKVGDLLPAAVKGEEKPKAKAPAKPKSAPAAPPPAPEPAKSAEKSKTAKPSAAAKTSSAAPSPAPAKASKSKTPAKAKATPKG